MLRIRLGASALLALVIAAALNGQEKKDPPKEPPKDPPKVEQPPMPSPDARTFHPKFAKDKSFYQETVTQVTQIIKVQGQDLTQNQNSTFWFKWTPLRQEGDKWVLEQEVEGLKMTIDISGNVISYDSTKPDGGGSGGNPGLMEFFKKLIGTKFTVTLDKNFRVESVAGREEFIKSLGAGSQQMDTLLKNLLTDEALKEMADPTFHLVPDSPKKPGETWKRESTTNLGPIGSYTVTYNFKYVGPATEADRKGMDKIEVDTAIVYTAPKTNPDGLLFRIKEGKLTSDNPVKGVIFFDPAAGRIAFADLTVKLKGDLTVTIGGTDTKVELTQEQNTKVRMGETTLKPVAGK